MKKILLITFLVLMINLVSADVFIHEGDHNYTVSNVEMTTAPFSNGFLILNFTLRDETGNVAKNTHIHVITYDDRNALVNDYSFKTSSVELLEKNLNHPAIENSEGYLFFRRIPHELNLLENRIVSDDNGLVSMQLFLNECGPNEVKNCYLLTGKYRVRVTQSNLVNDEYFTIEDQKIQTFFLVSMASFFGNNALGLATIFVILIFLILVGFLIYRWIKGNLRRND